MWVTITSEPIRPEEVMARVHAPGHGGIVCFVGTVRDRSRGRRVLHLEYEAYPEMAEAKLREIADELMQRWDVADVAIAHRVGHLEVGEVAVVIALAAPHRQDLFTACRYAIDRLKTIVPIWKKEVFEGGEEWVSEHP
ncbi:MAG: molybdenum cofactor biosynthesis protein MoaE [Anaerolineae bacterium]|nr:molybdenum cofactor biosynthesis protein MoaE [Anaerolineae bacterium]